MHSFACYNAWYIHVYIVTTPNMFERVVVLSANLPADPLPSEGKLGPPCYGPSIRASEALYAAIQWLARVHCRPSADCSVAAKTSGRIPHASTISATTTLSDATDIIMHEASLSVRNSSCELEESLGSGGVSSPSGQAEHGAEPPDDSILGSPVSPDASPLIWIAPPSSSMSPTSAEDGAANHRAAFSDGYVEMQLRPVLYGFPLSITDTISLGRANGAAGSVSLARYSDFQAASERLAKVAAEELRPGDLVLFDDFPMMLLPGLLRSILPPALAKSLSFAFSFASPWPSFDVFQSIPECAHLLRSVACCNVVAFQDCLYTRHYSEAAEHMLGAETTSRSVTLRGGNMPSFLSSDDNGYISGFDDGHGRRVWDIALLRTPVGADFEASCLWTLGDEAGWKYVESTLFPAKRIKPACQMILAVDTLDIGQGTCQKILSYGNLLRTVEAMAGKVQFVILINDSCHVASQGAAPATAPLTLHSDASPGSWEEARRMALLKEIHESVDSVNTEFEASSSSSWVPIVLITQRLSPHAIRALMARCDVGYAAAIAEGNVSHAFDFAAAKAAYKLGKQKMLYNGSILYSDGAAGAKLVQGAQICRPWDAEYSAKVLRDAVELPIGDRHNKMECLIKVVAAHSCKRWCAEVAQACQLSSPLPSPLLSTPPLFALVQAINKRRSSHRPVTFLLSLDSFISPLAALLPSEPLIHKGVVTAARRLSSLPGVSLRLLSGASAISLTAALEDYPAPIAAECGFEVRTGCDGKWYRKYYDPVTDKEAALATTGRLTALDLGSWLPEVLRILKHACDRTPGCLLSRGKASATWCWALADQVHGLYQAKELYSYLAPVLATLPVVVALDYDHKVLSVRHVSLTEAAFLAEVAAEMQSECCSTVANDGSSPTSSSIPPLLCVLGSEQRPGDQLMLRKASYLRPGFEVWDIHIACPPLALSPALLAAGSPSSTVDGSEESCPSTRTAKYALPLNGVATFLQDLAGLL